LQACEWLWDVIQIPQMLLHATDPDVEAYTFEMVNLVCKHDALLSERIDTYAEDWKVDRLVKMDRLILKLALAEILHRPDIDTAVAVNEAVELAKIYSLPDSFKFINGILGKVIETIGQDAVPADA
jgi:transcription antitermination protein NusB